MAQTATETPFLFHTPAGMTPPPAGFWKPPQDFSPEKAFPPVAETTADVSMDDITNSPSSIKKEARKDASIDKENAGAIILARKVSTNAVKRVNKGRRRVYSRIAQPSEDEQGSESGTEDEGYTREGSINHHYTFNLPGLPANRSEVPYMLLGCGV